MRHFFGKLVSKLAPGVFTNIARIDDIDKKLNDVQKEVNNLTNIIEKTDTQLGQLKRLASEVEPYQPAYGITGVIESPARGSNERARAIANWLQPVAGQRILDIGSSLGYFSFYYADRGAGVEGWENNPKNAEVAKRIGELNGISVNFKSKEFNQETVLTIQPGEFDTALVLSVFHHIIYFHGLKYTQELVKELLDRVPVLIVELAKKGENSKLRWNKAQPKNELDIFELVKDNVTIKKIGDFHNHLSKNTRPIYVIENKKLVKVNNHRYNYTRLSKQAYKNSPVAHTAIGRRYYFGSNFVITEYSLNPASESENLTQILNSIKVLFTIRERKLKVFHAPKLLDFEINFPKSASVVIERTEGVLASDLISPIKAQTTIRITKDILRSLIDLEKIGLHHNDLRSWNVIIDPKNRGWLIDYGLVDHFALEDDVVALVWVTYTLLTNEREMPAVRNKALPSKEAFESSPKLLAFFEAVKSGERSLQKLYELL